MGIIERQLDVKLGCLHKGHHKGWACFAVPFSRLLTMFSAIVISVIMKTDGSFAALVYTQVKEYIPLCFPLCLGAVCCWWGGWMMAGY